MWRLKKKNLPTTKTTRLNVLWIALVVSSSLRKKVTQRQLNIVGKIHEIGRISRNIEAQRIGGVSDEEINSHVTYNVKMGELFELLFGRRPTDVECHELAYKNIPWENLLGNNNA